MITKPSLRTTIVAFALGSALIFAAAHVKAQSVESTEGSPDGGDFAPFLTVGGPQCVPLTKIRAAAADVQPLNEAAFRFVEALYVAIPPVSHTLPPGGKASLGIDAHGTVMAFIHDGKQACARILAPHFMAEMILQVQAGKTGELGTRM